MLYTNHNYTTTFCQEQLTDLQANITTNTSCNLVAMPGVGVTFLLQALAQDSSTDYIFINSYEMQEFTKDTVYAQLARKLGVADNDTPKLEQIQQALMERASQTRRLVIVFNRVDRLSAILDQNFYGNLRYLRDASRDNICIILVSSFPLLEAPAQSVQGVLSILTRTSYFPGYSNHDLVEVFESSTEQKADPRAITYSGGHHILLQVLMRCQDLDNPLSDPMVELVIKDLYLGLGSRRRRLLEATIARGTAPKDRYLLMAGYVRQQAGKYVAFTPLLADYVATLGKQYLPLKEKRLLQVLSQHQGQVVSKSQICDYVWHETNGIASDWALNALVYRLRRHRAFDSQHYSIESRKGEGYILLSHN